MPCQLAANLNHFGCRFLIWPRCTLSMPFYQPFFALGSSRACLSVAGATPMVFLYLPVQRAFPSSVICWICPQTNHGSSTINGRKPMVVFFCDECFLQMTSLFFAGDMVYFEVLGQPFLVLDTLRRANDFFDKRSTNYSDRMRMPMVLEL